MRIFRDLQRCSCRNLRSLTIVGGGLENDSLLELTKLFCSESSLLVEELRLSENVISTEGCYLLAKVLASKPCTKLRLLDLTSCHLGKDGICILRGVFQGGALKCLQVKEERTMKENFSLPYTWREDYGPSYSSWTFETRTLDHYHHASTVPILLSFMCLTESLLVFSLVRSCTFRTITWETLVQSTSVRYSNATCSPLWRY